MREHETFEASGVLPGWEKRRAQLDAERLGLHGRAMGLSAGSEAGDLLELLDDQLLTSARPGLMPPAPGTCGSEEADARSTGIAHRPRGVGR